MDTPYYEQLQYVGDTRIQALISYAVAGDDRLARQALRAFDNSRIPEGITRSRYPSSLPQSIPTFSLLYVDMLHDYWMYRPDPDTSPAASSPARAPSSTGSPTTNSPTASCTKCHGGASSTGSRGQEIPTYDKNGESCMTTLEYLGALTMPPTSKNLSAIRFSPTATPRGPPMSAPASTPKCWSASRGLLADTPDQNAFSQQANILAVLYDVIPNGRRRKSSQDTRHRARHHPRRRPECLLLLPLLSRPRAGSRRAWPTNISIPSTPGASCSRCTSVPGPKSPATPAPTPTPGAPTPSTTFSLCRRHRTRQPRL